MGRVTVARRRVIAAAERSKGSRRLLQLGSSFGLRWAKAKRGLDTVSAQVQEREWAVSSAPS